MSLHERRVSIKVYEGNTLQLDTSTPVKAIFTGYAYNAVISEQMITRTKGYETLQFYEPMNDESLGYLLPERYVVAANRVFVIKKVSAMKSTSKRIQVNCDALWYELLDGEPRNHTNAERLTAQQALSEQLEGTGWTVGTVDVTERHAYTIRDMVSPLYLIRYIQRLFSGELRFNTMTKTVDFLQQIGDDTNDTIDYSRNLKGITRTEDTSELTTRVYMYGRDGLTIADINDGKDYIEDYTWMDSQGLERKIKSYVITDDRFVILESMLEYMQSRLDTYSKPIVTYELDSYVKSGYLNMGDRVIVADHDFNTRSVHRVVERKIDLAYPEQSTYVLDFSLDDLSSESTIDDANIYTEERIEDVNTTLQDHIDNDIRHITNDERTKWNDTTTLFNDHRTNTSIHVTSSDKSTWNGYGASIVQINNTIAAMQTQIDDLETRVEALENA